MAYEPELGQALFGQPSQALDCPDYLEDAIGTMRELWHSLRDDECPFSNTGVRAKNDRFVVHAYDWADDEENYQQFNLAWNDLRVSWYKYAGRGMSVNRKVSKEETRQMLREFVDTVSTFQPDEPQGPATPKAGSSKTSSVDNEVKA